jgi:hypothetical protein
MIRALSLSSHKHRINRFFDILNTHSSMVGTNALHQSETFAENDAAKWGSFTERLHSDRDRIIPSGDEGDL